LEGGEVADGGRDGAFEVLVVGDGESGDTAGGVIALDVVPGAAVDGGGPRTREGVRREGVLEGEEGGQVLLVAGGGDGDEEKKGTDQAEKLRHCRVETVCGSC